MNLSKEQLLQIVREETLAEIGVRDALMGLGKAAVSGGEKLYRKGKEVMGVPPTHTGGRVTRGGSQGKRAQDASVVGVDASETPAEAEAALAAETPYGPEHSIYTATPAARGGGRVTAGGSGGERAKAAERLGVDPSQDPVDVDPWAFPGAPGEERSSDGSPGKPRRGHRGRGEPDQYGGQTVGQSEYFSGAYPKESLTRSRLRQAVMEEIATMSEVGARRRSDQPPEDLSQRWAERAETAAALADPGLAPADRRRSDEPPEDLSQRWAERAETAAALADLGLPRADRPRRRSVRPESLTRSRLRQAVMEELSDLRGEKILDEKKKKKKKNKDWIQKAVDPEHKGYCTPMTKKTCTPPRKALAKRFKKAARKEKKKGGTGWEGKV